MAVCHLCEPPQKVEDSAVALHLWVEHDFLEDLGQAEVVETDEGR